MTLYDILGVSKDATPEEIKKAHRTLSKEHHPDVGGDSHRFKDISKAYKILSNPDDRAYYDKHGKEPLERKNDEQQAIGKFVAVFLRVIQSNIGQITTCDVIGKVIQELNGSLKGINEKISKVESIMNNLEEAKGRLKLKNTDVPNYLMITLEQEMRSIFEDKETAKREKVLIEKAIVHAENYNYEYELLVKDQALYLGGMDLASINGFWGIDITSTGV
jgi:DnaJ-class molecular chaperone